MGPVIAAMAGVVVIALICGSIVVAVIAAFVRPMPGNDTPPPDTAGPPVPVIDLGEQSAVTGRHARPAPQLADLAAVTAARRQIHVDYRSARNGVES
jgi:hypothetical protein